MIIASVENKENRLKVAADIYDALSKRKISLATPWLSNLRSNKNISSCFIIQVNDNMESIATGWKNAAMISKNGGGLGIDLSRIRAKGSAIDGRENSSKGVASWAKIFNDIAVAVDQGGKRAGAFTVHLPIWHRDIEDFLELQTENGDFRKKAFDIFPQVGIMDAFMREVTKDDGGIWYTFCPDEVSRVLNMKLYGSFNKEFNLIYRKCIQAYEKGKLQNVGVYNAKELIKHIMKVQFESGLPYLFFLDRVNEHNPNSHVGYIPCGNLCQESYSVVEADKYAHTCNLASVVVGRIDGDSEMIRIARLCTRILDNGIELTYNPIKESSEHNRDFRTIGIGIQGLHDYVAKNRLNWESYTEFTQVAELIEYGAVMESIELAKERGKYPLYEGSKWDNGEMIEKFKRCSVSELCFWSELEKDLKEYGIRNSQLTSPAPNTSTSIFMDASAGVLPVYSAFYNEDNKTGKFSVYGMYLRENPLSYEMTASRQDQSKLSRVIGSIQKFVDTGISAEYIFDQNDPNFSARSLFDLIVNAWKNKTKAIYYIRSIKKGETIDHITGGESVCVGCAG
jgi:ribonucleoside-diphosphate reductase alpha chain